MAGEPKAKVIISADTAEFNKGIKSAKADMKAFGDASEGILGKLGQALGIDTKQLDQMSSAIRGMGQKLGQAGGEGEGALNKIAAAAKGAGAGIAAIGIGAAIASFKILNDEATAFKNTIAGANLELQTKAYIDTYRQVFFDFNAGTAQNVAEFESAWQKGFARWKANFSQTVANTLSGHTGWVTAIAGPLVGSFFGNRDQRTAATDAAERAEQISWELYNLARKESDQTRVIADLDREIAEQKAIMRDETYDLVQRQAAYDTILAKIDEKEKLLLPIERQRTALMDEMVSLASSSPDAIDAANQQYVKQVSISQQLTNEKTALLRYANSLNRQETKNTEELQKQLQLQQQIAASRAELAATLAGAGSASLELPNTLTANPGSILPQQINNTAFHDQIRAVLGGALVLDVELNIDKAKLVDVSQQLSSWLAGTAETLSGVLGGLIGDLVTGGDAWGNFANAALSAFGDMATAVGKIAIETGIASLGIKASLESLGTAGPAIAIAAGAALVALGAAVKAGLSNVASGSYSSGYNVANSSYGSTGGDYETRELNVKVTGTMVADGSQLKAVLKSTDNRDSYTT